MILWDRVKKNFDSGVEVIRRVSVSISERARIESAVARLMIDKGSLETKLDKASQVLGERVYTLSVLGAEEVLKDGEVRESLKEVAGLNDRISELALRIKKVSLGEEDD